MSGGRIVQIAGPTAKVVGIYDLFMNEIVYIGDDRLMAEVIRIDHESVTVQIFEESGGIPVGEAVQRSGKVLSIDLGPGLLGSVLDGIGRPLDRLSSIQGNFLGRGTYVSTLDKNRFWKFTKSVCVGDEVEQGMVIGEIPETTGIIHRVMVPIGCGGKIAEIKDGEFTVDQSVALLSDGTKIGMMQSFPVHEPRPIKRRLPLAVPLVTGQRVLDTLFPVAEGASAIIPGGFGTGKTVLEQSIAKQSNADVIVYIGCGERGNEMAGLLKEFPELDDPHTGRSLMERTVLIANTSNMPVAAREASIYTGITIAEYYRDMGYRCAVMADSTSRWAEALREISSRLQELPGEEGYPTYLPSRLGAFYERAGRVRTLGGDEGSITIIGAVSPPGGDFSEPVTQASLRISSAYWALDYDLAHRRHFPAIDWLSSYSLTAGNTVAWFKANLDENWPSYVARLGLIFEREKELAELVSIVGLDTLQDKERLEYESARILREGYLRQSSFSSDAFCSLSRQAKLLGALLWFIDNLFISLKAGKDPDYILGAPMIEHYIRLAQVDEDVLDKEIEKLATQTELYLSESEEI